MKEGGFTFTSLDHQTGRSVTVTQDGDSNLETILEAFESFLIASGFSAKLVQERLSNESTGGHND